LAVVAPAPGCFQQDNNAEYLRTAPPTTPGDPNEDIAQRKSRMSREFQGVLASKKVGSKSAKKSVRKGR
jgi:hypothetical protein